MESAHHDLAAVVDQCFDVFPDSAVLCGSAIFQRHGSKSPMRLAGCVGSRAPQREQTAAIVSGRRYRKYRPSTGVNAGQEPPLFDGEDTDLVLSAHASATRGNSC